MIYCFCPSAETHCMLFVKFLPATATQDALDELIPGSTSVVIAMSDEGVQRKYVDSIVTSLTATNYGHLYEMFLWSCSSVGNGFLCDLLSFPYYTGDTGHSPLRSTATFVIFFIALLLAFCLHFFCSSAFLTFFFTQCSNLSCGLPCFLQPPCFFVSAPFGNLSRFIPAMTGLAPHDWIAWNFCVAPQYHHVIRRGVINSLLCSNIVIANFHSNLSIPIFIIQFWIQIVLLALP